MISTVRPSAMPRFFACASSVLKTSEPYIPDSAAARLGNAAHEAMALHVRGAEVDITGLALRHGVDSEELDKLYAAGDAAWSQLETYFPDPMVEQRVESFITSGTADVLSRARNHVAVLDWKSGRTQRDYQHQLTAYAFAAAQVRDYGVMVIGDDFRVTSVVVWLRHGTFDVASFGINELLAFAHRFEQQQQRIGQEFAPGEHCTHCPRQNVCDARKDYVRQAAGALEPYGAGVTVSPRTLAELYPRAKALEAAIAQYREAVRMHVLANGPLALGNGHELTLEEDHRTTIDPRTAWPVMKTQGLSDTDLAGVVKIGKGALLDAVRERVKGGPRGAIGEAKEAMMAALDNAGALRRETVEVLRERRTRVET